MTGSKIVVPIVNPSLAYRYDDPILSEGSLALLDFTHPANPADEGVPTNGATFPNIAWKECARAIGSGTETTLQPTFVIGGAITGSVGTLERSSLGGLHCTMSATTALGTGKGYAVLPPQLVVDHLVDNPTNSYYVSAWVRFTRWGENTGRVLAYYLNSSPNSTNQVLVEVGASSSGTGPAAKVAGKFTRSRASWMPSQDATLPELGEEVFVSASVDGNTGTVNVSGATALALTAMLHAGGLIGSMAGGNVGFQSKLFRRAYIEDLTLSGRTWAQVDAIDQAEWTKQCNTVGGRYYNDTYTTPALA